MSLQKDLKLNNISSIGESAFSNCISLENVVIGKNLKEISARALAVVKILKKLSWEKM